MTPMPLLPALLLLLLAGCAIPAQFGASDRDRVAGRTYVVTGASSGIGRGVALRLASYGANVVLAARRTAVLDEVAQQVRAAGGQSLVVTTDTSDPDQMARLQQAALQRFGRIDVWINDAAVAAIGRFDAVPLPDHGRVVDVNLKGYIDGSYLALQQFRRQGFGTLVNVASVEGKVGVPYHASYSATKFAIVGLDRALSQELRLQGLSDRIHVVSVLPWGLDTPFWDHTANYSGGTPRFYTMDGPEEAVNAVVYASIHPQKELAVGWKAKGAVLGAQIWPGLADHAAGALVNRSQVETAPPAPATDGTLFAPAPAGTGVEGGARARMEREDAARGAR
jgi:short-subunit dehydrogenase